MKPEKKITIKKRNHMNDCNCYRILHMNDADMQNELNDIYIYIQGVPPKKVGFTATITSSKSHFFLGHLVYTLNYIQFECKICLVSFASIL